MEMPDRFGPFQPWFFNGVAIVEIVMMTAFGFAVIKSIVLKETGRSRVVACLNSIYHHDARPCPGNTKRLHRHEYEAIGQTSTSCYRCMPGR